MSHSEKQDPHAYKKGDHVLVTSLNQRGVVESVLSKDKFVVQIGRLSFTARTQDLEPSSPPPPPSRPYAQMTRAALEVVRDAQKKRKQFMEIDLHGMRVDRALAAVEKRIDEAVLAGLDEVQVIHGFGTGAIYQALIKALPTIPHVSSWSTPDSNRGMTRVFLS